MKKKILIGACVFLLLVVVSGFVPYPNSQDRYNPATTFNRSDMVVASTLTIDEVYMGETWRQTISYNATGEVVTVSAFVKQ